MKIELDVMALFARTIEEDIEEIAPHVKLNRFVYPNEHNGHATVEVEGDEADLADLAAYWGYEWEEVRPNFRYV